MLDKIKRLFDIANKRGAFVVDESVEVKMTLINLQKEIDKIQEENKILKDEQLSQKGAKEAPQIKSKRSEKTTK